MVLAVHSAEASSFVMTHEVSRVGYHVGSVFVGDVFALALLVLELSLCLCPFH